MFILESVTGAQIHNKQTKQQQSKLNSENNYLAIFERKLYTAAHNVLIIYYWLNFFIINIIIVNFDIDNVLETNKTCFKPSTKLKHNIQSGSDH